MEQWLRPLLAAPWRSRSSRSPKGCPYGSPETRQSVSPRAGGPAAPSCGGWGRRGERGSPPACRSSWGRPPAPPRCPCGRTSRPPAHCSAGCHPAQGMQPSSGLLATGERHSWNGSETWPSMSCWCRQCKLAMANTSSARQRYVSIMTQSSPEDYPPDGVFSGIFMM